MKITKELINEMEPFTTNGSKNDQIDDAYLSLQEVNGLIKDSQIKLDEVNKKMSDYLKNGRQYLY